MRNFVPALLLAVVVVIANTYPPVNTAKPCKALEPDKMSIELNQIMEPTEQPIKIIIPKTCYPLKDWERTLICRVMMSECPFEPAEGQRAVAQVILDRLQSDAFPDTVYEVLNQTNQFAGPSDADVLPEITEAVSAVFDRGERVTVDPIYWFYNPAFGWSGFHERQDYAFTISNHKFFS
jgi:N-acetylmuramoyl-L-alanine amidase